MFDSMRIYIERNGRPYNYLPTVDELNVKRDEHLTQEEKDDAQVKEKELQVKVEGE